jgi:Neuraminidase (sialidase)
MRSDDGGETWTWPQVVLDGPVDDRDAGVLETQKGTLLVTTFTSIAFEERMPSDRAVSSGADPAWSRERLRRWRAARDRLNAEERKRTLGSWVIRSTNGGQTWSEPINTLVNSPHGPTQLSDGRLLYVGRQLWRSPELVGACESTDDGLTWDWIGEIPTTVGDDRDNYHELHAVEAADGRVIAAIRNHNDATQGEVLQTESADGGKTWTEPHRTGVWGYPSHLLRLKDNRLLMTSGHRREPWGNQASVSEDNGRTWSKPLVISADGVGRDLGYPSSVELDDGSIITVWYEQPPENGKPGGSEDQTLGSAVLRQARWSLSGE